MSDVVTAGAANLAAWHDASLAALGVVSDPTPDWWRAAQTQPSIYHSAVSRRRGSGIADRRRLVADLGDWADGNGTYLSVCDSFGELDLRPLGIAHRARAPWFHRVATADDPLPPVPSIPGLRIDRVADVEDLVAFERTVVRAYGARPPVSDLDIHAPGILADPAMDLRLARLDGAAVGVGMGYRAAGLVGVYGIGVVPEARGLGIATALTAAVLAGSARLPAVLQPSPAAEGLYRRLGFAAAGWYDHWA
ncbi:MAG: GNAT family N-acetyltransferase [Acidimicrobiales bacterium]